MVVCFSKANGSGVRGFAPAVPFLVTTKTGTTKTA